MNDRPAQRVTEVINGEFPVHSWAAFPTIVAVSGGADSVALLRAVAMIAQNVPEARKNLIVGHINHKTRPECDREQLFVAALAENLGVKYFSRELPADECAHVSEESLRGQRYEGLVAIASETGARFILTGHHLQDQIETIVFRLFRGSGLEGLKGIPARREIRHGLTLIRPMLSLSRKTLRNFLTELGQTWCEDSSNAEPRFARNIIRNQVLPSMANCFQDHRLGMQQIEKSLQRMAVQAAAYEEFLSQQVQQWFGTTVNLRPNRIMIRRAPMRDLPDLLVQSLIRQGWKAMDWPERGMTWEVWQRLGRDVKSKGAIPPFDLPGKVRCEIDDKTVTLTRNIGKPNESDASSQE